MRERKEERDELSTEKVLPDWSLNNEIKGEQRCELLTEIPKVFCHCVDSLLH